MRRCPKRERGRSRALACGHGTRLLCAADGSGSCRPSRTGSAGVHASGSAGPQAGSLSLRNTAGGTVDGGPSPESPMFRKRWVRRLAVAVPVAVVLVLLGSGYVRRKAGATGRGTRRGRHRPPGRRRPALAVRRNRRRPRHPAGRPELRPPRPPVQGRPGKPAFDTARPDKSDLFDKSRPTTCSTTKLRRHRPGPGRQRRRPGRRPLVQGLPAGPAAVHPQPGLIDTLLPDVQEHPAAAPILDLAAERPAHDGRPGAALDWSGHAQRRPRAGRRTVPDLRPGPHGLRRHCRPASGALLALGVPAGGLAEVQARPAAEAEADLFWGPLRGERAMMDRLFVNLRAGSAREHSAWRPAATGRTARRRPSEGAGRPTGPTSRSPPHDHAACLEISRPVCEVRRLPEHQQRAALARPIPAPPDGPGTAVTRLLLPAFDKFHNCEPAAPGGPPLCRRRAGGRAVPAGPRPLAGLAGRVAARTCCRRSRPTRSTASRSGTPGGRTV